MDKDIESDNEAFVWLIWDPEDGMWVGDDFDASVDWMIKKQAQRWGWSDETARRRLGIDLADMIWYVTVDGMRGSSDIFYMEKVTKIS